MRLFSIYDGANVAEEMLGRQSVEDTKSVGVLLGLRPDEVREVHAKRSQNLSV